MIILLILLIIYALSVIGAYIYTKELYKQGNAWDHLKPDYIDIIFIFTPIANTIMALSIFR